MFLWEMDRAHDGPLVSIVFGVYLIFGTMLDMDVIAMNIPNQREAIVTKFVETVVRTAIREILSALILSWVNPLPTVQALDEFDPDFSAF